MFRTNGTDNDACGMVWPGQADSRAKAKLMLVIISDLHLTDGSSSETTSPGALDIFARQLPGLAEAASWRTGGEYRPIDRIDLVLLGDTLDVIRSEQWSASACIRPWGNVESPEFFEQISRITGDILDNNETSLALLRGLADGGAIRIPPALRVGRPAPEGDLQSVPVRVFSMVGNHDWFFHLSGPALDTLRREVVRRMGLCNRYDEPFPHDITENDELLRTMRRHKIMARHGDLYDPLNFDGDRNTASLGDVIVIELINRFIAEIERQFADDLPAATRLGLREIDNIRPTLLVPVWIDGLLERSCANPSLRKRVKTLWDRLVEEFLAIDFVRQRDTWSPLDTVDGLRQALTFSRRLPVGWAGAVLAWLNKIRGSASDSYLSHAVAEQDFRNRRAKHIVYGHTHVAESVPLDASYAEGFVLNQVYFNAGTFRRVHRQTQLAAGEHEFIACDLMNYLVFYQGDERKGRPYETWSGTLGYNPAEVPVHRIDPGRKSHAQGQSVSAPNLHQRGPHFTVGATPAGSSDRHRI
ncbi:MAG: hypothetical protein GXY83_08650 [Rhodopirellula sp.]|nr:hypothetical protein [Rhodopirellula sp.]